MVECKWSNVYLQSNLGLSHVANGRVQPTLAAILLLVLKGKFIFYFLCTIVPGKSFIGEGSPSFKKLEKPVWRPKGRQLNKFRSLLFTKIKKKIAANH